MHYDCINGSHGLPHDPFKAIVAPRPIGWIGSKGKSGIQNLAPYSYFNAVADKPHFIMFSSVGIKDSVKNSEETGVFTFSLATEKLFDAMNGSSVQAAYNVDEFKLTNLAYSQGKYVDAPYVKDSPAALECKYWKTIDMPGANRSKGTGTYVILGQVVGIFINDSFIKEGLFDASEARPIVRLGYMNYGVVGKENTFTKNRPQLDKEGNLMEINEWDGKYR